jgi:hypothetical protein
VELVEVKREDVPPTRVTVLPEPMAGDPVVFLTLQPQQVMEVALMAALMAVGLYTRSVWFDRWLRSQVATVM